MNKRRGLAVGVCVSLLFIVLSSSASTASQITSTKCSKAGTYRTVKALRYQCKKSVLGLRWVIALTKPTPTTTTTTATTTTATTTNLTIPSPILTNVAACKLKDMTLLSGGTLGFPRVSTRLPSTGMIRIGIVFVDFTDSIAAVSTESTLGLYSPDFETQLHKMSYGRLSVELFPLHGWARMSKESSSYRLGRGGGGGGDATSFLDEAIRLGARGTDINSWDSFIVLANARNVVATSQSPPKGMEISAGGRSWVNGVLLGTENGHLVSQMIHEVGHNLGLLDLYPFSGVGFRYTGEFGLMGNLWGTAPELYAWERWTLNWLEDTQVICLESRSVTAYLSPVSNSGGQKMIVSPISESKALVVEVRRKVGYDKAITEEGPLVYLVDTSIPAGYGTIKVLPLIESDAIKSSAPLNLGETIEFEGISITYKSREAFGDEVIVTRTS